MAIRYLGDFLMVPADAVKPHPRNANNGDVELISDSLRLHGCYRPVYASAETRHIVAGHHLYTALLEAGEPDIPVQWIKGLSAEDELRLLVADNRIPSKAWVDNGLMIPILDELANSERGLEGLGYDSEDLAFLKDDDAHGFGDALADEALEEITEKVECPACGHTFDRTV